MERIDVAVLPRASRLDGNEFGTNLLPRIRQSLAEELRAVVAPDSGRRTAATNYSGHDASHVGTGHRLGRMEQQSLPRGFVHQRQPLERRSSGGPIMNEIACPDIVLQPGLPPGAIAAPDAELGAVFPGPFHPHPSIQPRSDPEPMDSLEIRRPAPTIEHRVDSPVPDSGMTPGQAFDLPDRGRLVGSVSPIVSQGRSRSADDAAGPPLRDLVPLGQVVCCGLLLVGGHH